MKTKNLKNLICFLMLSFIVALSANTFAKEKISFSCPILTADEVKFVIQQGHIESDPLDHTLSKENRGTEANPNNAYYRITAVKNAGTVPYLVYIGNILAASEADARNKANDILFAPEKAFAALPQSKRNCWYKMINVSDDETITLIATNVKHHLSTKASKKEIEEFSQIPVIPSTTVTPF